MNPHLDELISIVNHPAIQGRRGEWLPGDRYWIKSYHLFSLIVFDPEQIPNHAIWLPPLSDPIQPERGLWGMINWNRWNMYVFPDRVCMYDHKKGNNNIEIVGPTPEIAVCKAIVAQSEEEK